jgi:peptidoglycan/xylan/chitin deacetylase (PgdA/CDA1 family)
VIGWNIRSLDTTTRTREQIMENIRKSLAPGAIILFHDTSMKSAELLEETLKFAQESGFKIVSVDRLLNLRPYA